MNDTILSISDTVNDLKELTDYAKYIVGVNEKDIHKSYPRTHALKDQQ